LDRSVQTGHLTADEHQELDEHLEVLANYSFPQQSAAVDKFLSLGPGRLRRITDKGKWLHTCLNYIIRTNLATPESNTCPSGLLLSALAEHALLTDVLTSDCWQMYLELPVALQKDVAFAVSCSILANVEGKISEHFLNLVENEQKLCEMMCKPAPQMERWPPHLEWDAIDGSLYHRLMQRLIFRGSEEQLLKELCASDTGVGAVAVEPGALNSLLYSHSATAQPRQQGTAEVLSLLHAAAAAGLVRICARLIAEGLDIDEKTGDEQVTPLHLAAASGELEVIRLLLDKRADPNARDGRDRTPLYAAVQAAVQLHERRDESQNWHSLHLPACSLLLLAGAEDSESAADEHGGPPNALALAQKHGLTELRNVIRLHMCLDIVKDRYPMSELAIIDLSKLQFETAMFIAHIFEKHLNVKAEAAMVELRALIASEFIQARDRVQRLGNRLARKLGLSKKAIDALAELPPQAGEFALRTWNIEEVVPDVYKVPEGLNICLRPPPPPPLLPEGSDGDPADGEVAMAAPVPAPVPAPTPAAPAAPAAPPKVQGRIRKWDSERGFGFLLQDPEEGEEVGKDIFVHRKNILGSTPSNHLDLREGCRISFKPGLQDGRPRALEATMLDNNGHVLDIHLSKKDDAQKTKAKLSLLESFDDTDPNISDTDLTGKFMRYLKSPIVQDFAKEKRGKIESWLRCVGLCRYSTGRRDDAIWKREIDRRIDFFLERNSTPLDKNDFDFRVRRFLLEFSVHSTVTRVSEALAFVEASTIGKKREDVRSWPAYLATLLRNFDPKLHDLLADRDRRSRLRNRQSKASGGGSGIGDGPEDGEDGANGRAHSDDDDDRSIRSSELSGIERDQDEPGGSSHAWRKEATPPFELAEVAVEQQEEEAGAFPLSTSVAQSPPRSSGLFARSLKALAAEQPAPRRAFQ